MTLLIEKYINKCIKKIKIKNINKIENDIQKELIKIINQKKTNNCLYIFKNIKKFENNKSFFINLKYNLNKFYTNKQNIQLNIIKISFLIEKKKYDELWIEINKNIINELKYDKRNT